MKKLLSGSVVPAVVALIVWIVGYLVWQVRITTALAAMESQAVSSPGTSMGYSVPPETVAELRAAGDRALPYIVDRLDARKSPIFLAAASRILREALETAAVAQDVALENLQIQPGDTPEERARKCDEWRRLWKENGAPRHRGWKWWSSTNLR